MSEKISQKEVNNEQQAENINYSRQLALMEEKLLNLKLQGVGHEGVRIDLMDIWRAAWAGKWLIIVITTVFAIASIAYALSLSDKYKSSAILVPSSLSGGSSLSKLAGKFGGLASLAGINLNGGQGENKTIIALELIKSWGFLEKFVANNQIEVEVMASTGWNRSSGELIIDPDLYDKDKKAWVREFDPAKGETAEPNSWELYEEIESMIDIDLDKETGLISLTVEHYSPTVAKDWVDKLIIAINDHIKTRDKSNAIKSLEYLNKQIEIIKISEMQTIFFQLVEEQTKNLMLAEVTDEYVLKTISEAKVAREKSGPFRVVLVILGTMLGGLIGVLIVLLGYFKREVNIENK